MKISKAKAKCEDDYFVYVEIRKNPSKRSEYIALLYGRDGKSFMLCHENDSVVSSHEVEHLTLLLKQVGFSKAKLYF